MRVLAPSPERNLVPRRAVRWITRATWLLPHARQVPSLAVAMRRLAAPLLLSLSLASAIPVVRAEVTEEDHRRLESEVL